MAEDPVDAAIAAAEAPGAIAMVQRQVTISSTGRPVMLAFPPDLSDAELFELAGWLAVMLAFPPDLSDAELFELVGWLAVGLRGELAARRVAHDPKARLWTPGAAPVPRSS